MGKLTVLLETQILKILLKTIAYYNLLACWVVEQIQLFIDVLLKVEAVHDIFIGAQVKFQLSETCTINSLKFAFLLPIFCFLVKLFLRSSHLAIAWRIFVNSVSVATRFLVRGFLKFDTVLTDQEISEDPTSNFSSSFLPTQLGGISFSIDLKIEAPPWIILSLNSFFLF